MYTSDTGAAAGYIWKYMYTVSAADTIKYVTSDFIPVKTLGAKPAVAGTGTNGHGLVYSARASAKSSSVCCPPRERSVSTISAQTSPL